MARSQAAVRPPLEKLEKTVLKPRGSTSFKAKFPGVFGFDRPDFQIESFPLALRAENQSEQDD
jgi:hypothetical protein